MGLPLSAGGGQLQGPHDEAWPLQVVPDAVKIKHLQVQCEKTHMRVNIEFDRPFYGVIFSKGTSEVYCTDSRKDRFFSSFLFFLFFYVTGAAYRTRPFGRAYEPKSVRSPSGRL